jgi:hypothetical protein
MGSLVGASEEVKRTGGIDTSLNEYAVSKPFRMRCTPCIDWVFVAFQFTAHARGDQFNRRLGSSVTPSIADGICWTPANH